MKKLLFLILILCLVSLGACLSEDESRWSDYSGVYVTVAGDDIRGYQFYTDFDAILEPSAESLKNLEWVKQARRVVIGFDLEGEQTDLESGKTYPVILKSAQQIPTFIVSVDTLSDEYQRNGLDSIALKNESIRSIDDSKGAFYMKNGYLNLVATFDYSPTQPTYFLLYYDGEKDIDVVNKRLSMNLYFNNSVDQAYHTISSFISLEAPESVYSKYLNAGMNMSDSIELCLNVNAATGPKQMSCKLALKDLLLP